MEAGAFVVDTAVDQGGCVESMKVTTHSAPTYVVDDVVHCGIADLPGAVPRTATMVLSNATYPYVFALGQ